MKKIFYRPHGGGLAEAMADIKKFDSIKEMLDYIVEQHNHAFDTTDIYISYYGYDSRIDWDTFIITVSRYYDENYLKKYQCPQAIGFCAFK